MTRFFSEQVEDKNFSIKITILWAIILCQRFFFFGSALQSILSSVQCTIFVKRGHFNYNKGQFLKIEDKLKLSEDRGQSSKIEDSPLKKQADGHPNHEKLFFSGMNGFCGNC